MGTYREQLLKEKYGNSRMVTGADAQAEPSGCFCLFKLKFLISILLFAGFLYLNMTGQSFLNITAEQIRTAIVSEYNF